MILSEVSWGVHDCWNELHLQVKTHHRIAIAIACRIRCVTSIFCLWARSNIYKENWTSSITKLYDARIRTDPIFIGIKSLAKVMGAPGATIFLCNLLGVQLCAVHCIYVTITASINVEAYEINSYLVTWSFWDRYGDSVPELWLKKGRRTIIVWHSRVTPKLWLIILLIEIYAEVCGETDEK